MRYHELTDQISDKAFAPAIALVESPESDVERGQRSRDATMELISRIYAGRMYDHHVDLGAHGEFLVWGFKGLGMMNRFPELGDFCLMLALRNRRAVGLSGAVFRFETPLLGRYTRCIAIYGLKELTLEAAKSLVNSTAFINVASHEFIHAFDAARTPKMIDRASSSPIDSPSKTKYYNDPAEFNAYYHDVVDALTSVANASREDMHDYASLYGITGDFKQDLSHMLNKDIFTTSFVKWLIAPRRKALLRRIYKLHQHVMTLLARPTST